jgi:hypothetical protein
VRVKISYGVDLSDIPEELTVLMDYVYNKKVAIDKQLDVVDDSLEREDIASLVLMVEQIRKTMLDMDGRLSDIDAIARGYLAHTSQGEEDVSDGRPVMDSTGDNSDGAEPQQSSFDLHK